MVILSPPMTTLPDSFPDTECNFWEEISSHLLAVSGIIQSYNNEQDDRFSDAWVVRPFSVKNYVISYTEVTTKVEFLRIREDNQLRIDFTEQELPTFCETRR